jgi:ElaB/YqjD/DUF883 family membrane-anchored ribosome-binding protein
MERPDELNTNADVEQLKAEISDTQAELQQTVAEIQDRLSPANLKHQAADTVREATTNMRDNVRDATIGRVQHMVRGQNPIPFALIGIGAAWLLMNRRTSGGGNSRSDYTEYDASWNSSTSSLSPDDGFASPYVSETFAHETERTKSLGRVSSEARQRAAEVGRQARERARRVADRARSRWDTMLHGNPMALGIAALAAGAVVGAALPRTEMEDEYMGETRDNLVDSARSMTEETIQKVTGSEGQRP